MGENNKLQYFQILIISISFLLHLCLVLGVSLIPPKSNIQTAENVEVDFIVAENIPERKVVEIDPNQEKLSELKKKVKRLSQFTTRVKKETTARRTGAVTRNGKKGNATKKNNTKPTYSGRMKELFNVSDADLYKKQNSNQTLNSSLPILSTTSNYIPNVEQANASALNADQFKYFSYYSRLKNKLYPKWTNKIQQIVRHSSSMQLYRLASKTRYTQLKAVLNKSGYIKKISLVKSSGVQALDHIAIQAFRNSSPILNPPAGMVQDDGLIYIHYGFNVQFNPRHIVRKNR